MIQLFDIPRHRVDTADYPNVLGGSIVQALEDEVAAYVGARYAVSLSSATAGIFLLAKYMGYDRAVIPSMIPPVVPNALINSGIRTHFVDDTHWVGGSYALLFDEGRKLIDSAHQLDKDQYRDHIAIEDNSELDAIIYSFYPTKVVGGCDGGMVVSNDKELIDTLRCLANNGMTLEATSWNRVPVTPGWKMYMNAMQAEIAMQNLANLHQKKERLAKVRDVYNDFFGLKNHSDHLYRVTTHEKNTSVLEEARKEGITCGVHYKALHPVAIYSEHITSWDLQDLAKSETAQQHTVSIPYHEHLTKEELDTVCQFFADKLKA